MSERIATPAGAAASYDPGEQLRVTADGHRTLRVHHGATEVATIRPVLGGAIKVEADGRSWRLTRTANGWFAEGDPTATLIRRPLRRDVLKIGAHEYRVGKRSVKGLLRLRLDKDARTPYLRGEILAAPPHTADAHATIALATAAVVLTADLSPDPAHSGINGDNVSAALRYGPGGI